MPSLRPSFSSWTLLMRSGWRRQSARWVGGVRRGGWRCLTTALCSIESTAQHCLLANVPVLVLANKQDLEASGAGAAAATHRTCSPSRADCTLGARNCRDSRQRVARLQSGARAISQRADLVRRPACTHAPTRDSRARSEGIDEGVQWLLSAVLRGSSGEERGGEAAAGGSAAGAAPSSAGGRGDGIV